MAKAVFTASDHPDYEDLRGHWYHFPNTYLVQVTAALGDLVIFYEPRRSNGSTRSGGSQSYFAMARVIDVRRDPRRAGHHFADLSEYVEFDERVPFKIGSRYFESALKKADGSTNRGAFGRSVRLLAKSEFDAILSNGFAESVSEVVAEGYDVNTGFMSPSDLVADRATVNVTRKIRAAAFRRHVLHAYGNTCAFTGLKLIDAEGHAEAQAAHIRPLASAGSDSVHNGIAMTATAHWLFDRGIIGVGDDYSIIVAREHASIDDVIRLRNTLFMPLSASGRPHPDNLAWHRAQVFLG